MNHLKFAKENKLNDLRFYSGEISTQMPKLIESGQIPLSSKDIIELKITAWNSPYLAELDKYFGENYTNGADGVMYHPDGRIKFVSNSQNITNINRESHLELSTKAKASAGINIWTLLPIERLIRMAVESPLLKRSVLTTLNIWAVATR